MERNSPRAITVVYPANRRPKSLIEKLQADQDILLHVFSYEDWLESAKQDPRSTLIFVREDGSWRLVLNGGALDNIKDEVRALVAR
jgi:hypothetical protein